MQRPNRLLGADTQPKGAAARPGLRAKRRKLGSDPDISANLASCFVNTGASSY